MAKGKDQKINAAQKYHLKKFLENLAKYRGRHTELVTVYVPVGYDLNKIINHIAQEQGTATNIKSKQTQKAVVGALERMIQHLKLFKNTPPNGLAVFSGNISEKEGQDDIQVWSIEPPLPMNQRLYRCDKEFVLEPLKDMLETNEVYGLVVMDRRDATIAVLKGKTIIPLAKTHSEVPGKFKAGGQCLVKNTIIQSFDGNIIELKNSHNPLVIKSMRITSKNDLSLIDSPITERWEVKKSKIYKIRTKCPRIEIEASKDHIFLVRSEKGMEEKPAELLKEGDFLIMPEIINVKGRIQTIRSVQYYNSFTINEEGQKILKSKRESKKFLQKDVAKMINTTQTTISSYEIGKLNADRLELQKLCAALEIDFYDFLNNYSSPYMYRKIDLPVIVDKKIAQFLGYLIGDGCIEKDRISFFEQDQQVCEHYKECYDKYFGIKSSYRFRKEKNYHQLKFTSRPLVRLIQAEFPEIKKALDTMIPDKILKSPDEIVASFLKGIFDAEGYVSGGKLGIGMNNKLLIKQIQMTLLRFSIISSVLEYDNKANKYSKNHRFTIEISEKQSLEFFRNLIGFTSDIKSEKLKRVLKIKSSASYVRQILASGKKVRKIIESSGHNLELFPKVNNFFRDERMISKAAFKNSILANVKDEKLKKELEKIYETPFIPVKINKIEIRDEEVNMIDISVGNKNFIANGVIVHNSAARFARLREGAAKDHFKKVAEYMKEQFLFYDNLKGILLGGPGPTKYDFHDGNYITNEVKKKIIAIRDLGYTDEFGLDELVEKSQDVLAEEEIAHEKELMTKFFNLLAKSSGKAAYGEAHVLELIKMGVVETVLLSDSLEDEKIQEFEKEAEKMNTAVEIISTETREGAQLKEMRKVAAILRYEMNTDNS